MTGCQTRSLSKHGQGHRPRYSRNRREHLHARGTRDVGDDERLDGRRQRTGAEATRRT